MGSVSLAVQRVPPSGPQVGTIVLLAGGPGQAALPVFDEFFGSLARLPELRDYELLSFDQRGTGQSGALNCPGLLREGLPDLTRCAETLGAARTDYTSQDSVEDLEELRQALGGAPLSLFAVSYGAKVAAMYALEHPEGVSRMVLDSPVPLDGSDALDSQRLRALPRVLDQELCGRGRCRSFTRESYRDLTRLITSLRRHPKQVRILDGRGRRETVRLSEAGVYGVLALTDLAADLRALIPAAVADAVKGNPVPLARLTSSLPTPTPTSAVSNEATSLGSQVPSVLAGSPEAVLASKADTAEEAANRQLSLALLVSTLCVESPLPWTSESPLATRAGALRSWIATLPPGTTAPFQPGVVGSEAPGGICRSWPPTPPAPPVPSGISATPTLILSGDEDLRTPYEEDQTVAAGYSDVRLLRIPGSGHSTITSDSTGCAQHAMIAFLAGGQAPASCQTPSESQVLPPPPSWLNELHPARSTSKLAGRAASAVVLTIREILGQPSSAGGGLLGGSWHVQGTQLIFDRLIDVPGVSLSGALQLTNSTSRFAIGGRVNGKLELKGTSLSGRLNGAAVHTHLF